MSRYYCQLGNTPDLSWLELQSLESAASPQRVSSHIATVELDTDEQANQLLNISGGIVKIMRQVGTLSDSSDLEVQQGEVVGILADELPAAHSTTFNVAELNRDHLEAFSLPHIKHELKRQGVTAHYREGSRHGLSASVLLHHKVVEIVVISLAQEVVACLTVGVQNIDAWTIRDREKPYADRKKGMLPPKVARMMVNIALGAANEAELANKRVYDPYCGTGTVLFEAALRGAQAVGSDLDLKAAEGVRTNWKWFQHTYKKDAEVVVFALDAARATENDTRGKIDFIVTEPFLGKQTPMPSQLANIFKGLGKQYWAAFRAWTDLLQDGAKIVIVFPMVEDDKKIFSLEHLIDKLATLGYTISSEPVLYHRPYAVVQRQIFVFRYNKPSTEEEK